MSRREIALSPLVWFAVSGSFALFAVACAAIALLADVARPAALGAFSLLLAVIAATLARRPAPEPDAPLTHLVIVLAYLGTSAAMVLMAPYTVAALPVAIFVGALSAVWLDRPRQIAAHWTVATLCLLAVSIVGPGDSITLIATLTLVPPSWALGLISLWVLTTAERQSDRLERLAMRDALTGVGNRRLLDERLGAELARHRALHRPLSIVALDLNGFKAVNDRYGHAAGDDLLRHVGITLSGVAGERATVVRQGGDEFCLLLPGADLAAAEQVAHAAVAALAPVVGTGIGMAAFPADGSSPERLLELADARLTASKVRPRTEVPPHGPPPKPGSPPAAPAGRSGGQRWMAGPSDASRRTIGGSQVIWWATGAMFVFYAVVGALVLAFKPELTGPGFPPVLAFGSIIAVAICGSKSPPIHTRRSDAVVAMSYLIPAALVLTTGEHASVAVGAAVFMGPLVAIRTQSRLRAGAHLTAAIVTIAGAGVLADPGLGPSLAILLLLATMIVLAVCCIFVLEAAERQGLELARLAVTDPLTGLANRRGLEEALDEALAADEAAVTVFALDLDGFKALNDALGHGAGDDILVGVAGCLREIAGESAIIARPGGDEFIVAQAGLSAADAVGLSERIRARVRQLSRGQHRIGTGVGVAASPADGRAPGDLLEIADERLRQEKYGVAAAGARA